MHEAYYTDSFAHDEATHWWYRARRRILSTVIRGIAFPAGARILDIGTGSGANLYSIYPEDAVLCGIEPSPDLAAIARKRGPIPVYVGTAEQLPPPVSSEVFDAAAMLDVLEHTEDDGLVLAGIRERLTDGGVLLITVPAYMLLWTAHDVAVGHCRRYRLRPLTRLLRTYGFGIERATYFNSLLLVPLAVFRIARRLLGAGEEGSDTKFGLRGLNQLLYWVFSLEQHLLKWLNFPAGVSILVIARKRLEAGPAVS